MRKSIINFTLLLLPLCLYSQGKYDCKWVLNQYNLLDFSDDTLRISIAEHTVNYGSGDFSSSISNSSGELLFYSGGCHILNKNGEIMANGNNINSQYAYDGFCGFGDFPLRQSNTIIPFPNRENQYIFFNLDLHIIQNSAPSSLNLLYHVIDMELNNSLGDVVENNQSAVSDTLNWGNIQAVRHLNGIDWWIISAELNSNCFYITPVTDKGVEVSFKQCIEGIWNLRDGAGQVVFSPDRTKFARIEANNGWHIFDFDSSNGELTNPILLKEAEIENNWRGAAFSPDSRFLYVCTSLELFQFDLESENIKGSMQLVGRLDPYQAFPGVGTMGLLQLAPNGKIYVASPGAHNYLSVINQPNCPSEQCDFMPWEIALPNQNFGGLPNLPHFKMQESENNCDQITSLNNETINKVFNFFPNPAENTFALESNLLMGKYIISDLNGTIRKTGIVDNEIINVNVEELEAGIFFISIQDFQGVILSTKKIIIDRK